MDKNEAQSVLTRYLDQWRKRSYQELVTLPRGNQGCDEVIGPSGTTYQIEVEVICYDNCVHVMAGIDDGHLLSALCPLCEDFIVAPDGSLVGEDQPNQAASADAAKGPPRG